MNNLCVGLILTIVCLMQISRLECAQPAVYYANVGSAANMPCTSGGGSFACFSTYAFQNQVFRMVYLNTTAKYQVMPGSVTVNNVQPTDAGFYACSNDCFQMKLDQISYYLQPMSNGQPTDLGKQFLAIPPFMNRNDPNKESLYVVVLDEGYGDGAGLTTGEIIGLVIGCVFLLLIAIVLVLLFIFLSRKKKQNREKMLESGKTKNDKDTTSVDYSTIERDVSDVDKSGEKKSLSSSRVNNSSAEINTKNIRGPNIYQPGNEINPKDLPSIDIHSDKSISQRSQLPIQTNGSKQGSYAASYSRQPSYQNQLDGNQIPRPSNRRDSADQNGIIPPPPKQLPVKNSIQFPSRHSSGSQQPPSNENLNNIIRESGYMPGILQEAPLSDDVFGRNMDNYPFDQSQEHLPPKRQSSTGGIDLESGDGGVTVVSARTPLRSDLGGSQGIPPTINRLQQPIKQTFQQQQQQMKPLPPHLSYSQRIETTSTPLQIPPPSASLRAPFNNGSKLSSNNLKDGSTDV